LNWHSPDDKSRIIISPQAEIEGYTNKLGDTADFGIAERFLMLETGKDISRLQSRYSIKQEAFQLPAFLGKRPIYAIEGDQKISLIEMACSAPVAVDALEIAIAMGCKKLFAFGLCGAVAEKLNVGDVIIPTEIMREEGTSYHYAVGNKNARPDENLKQSLLDFFADKQQLNVYSGKTVSTDAVFRQTLKKELKWRANGILGVDMEMSALLTVAEFHNIPAVSLLVVSDKHELTDSGKWHWGGDILEKNRKIALELFVEFVMKI